VVAPNICGSSVRKQLHVTLLAHRILRWFLEFWKIYKPLSIRHAICMYSILAVPASCNIGIYKGMCPYSVHTHIFKGASLQIYLCTLLCTCAVASSTECYRNVQMSTGNCFCDAGLGLAPYSSVQSTPVWNSTFWRWTHEFKTTSHI
jgi:hypothetical protein